MLKLKYQTNEVIAMEKKDDLIQPALIEKELSVCDSFHVTIEFIGKRWMGIIIYQLLNGPKRYHELLESIPEISDRLLTARLRDLEAHGIVIKLVSDSTPRKVSYELTQAGLELEGPINAIIKWVKSHGCHTGIEKM